MLSSPFLQTGIVREIPREEEVSPLSRDCKRYVQVAHKEIILVSKRDDFFLSLSLFSLSKEQATTLARFLFLCRHLRGLVGSFTQTKRTERRNASEGTSGFQFFPKVLSDDLLFSIDLNECRYAQKIRNTCISFGLRIVERWCVRISLFCFRCEPIPPPF